MKQTAQVRPRKFIKHTLLCVYAVYCHLTSSASTHAILGIKPSLKDAFNILKSQSAHWDDIGRQLDVPLNFRDELHKNSSLLSEQRLERVINHWLEKGCQNNVTWAGFIENLKELNYTALAEKVMKFLQRKTESEK